MKKLFCVTVIRHYSSHSIQQNLVFCKSTTLAHVKEDHAAKVKKKGPMPVIETGASPTLRVNHTLQVISQRLHTLVREVAYTRPHQPRESENVRKNVT